MNADIPEGLSLEERERLLEKEEALARDRDAEQRAFLDEQEKMRLAREKSQRMMTEQEEKARQAELERQEQQAQEVAEGTVEGIEDVDTGVASMFSSLAFGTDFLDAGTESAEEEEEQRPQ